MELKKIYDLARVFVQNNLRIILPAAALVLAVCLGLSILYRPRFVWIVEDQFIEAWEEVLPSSPFRKTKLTPLSAAQSTLPRHWYGYRIGSRQGTGTPGGDNNSIRVYRGLAGQGQYGEALPLAVDPWLVFRKTATSPLNREIAERGPTGNSRIFMAGSDQSAIRAWTAQLLQETPGVFSEDEERWNRIGERLFIGRNFQPGAKTFSWDEIWPHLLEDNETVWVYSPLSRIRQLPLYETNRLEADVFPARPGWNEFGLQAEILWAIPYGSQKNRKKLASAETWLQSAPAQAQIANALGWLAAHQSAPPFNPVSGNAQTAWFAASYAWEMVNTAYTPREQ
jgi:hypothetical protein